MSAEGGRNAFKHTIIIEREETLIRRSFQLERIEEVVTSRVKRKGDPQNSQTTTYYEEKEGGSTMLEEIEGLGDKWEKLSHRMRGKKTKVVDGKAFQFQVE